MNLNVFFTCATLVLLVGKSYGQDSLTEALRVTLAPLNLLDTKTGVMQLGVQKRFLPRLAIALDYGFRCNVLPYYRRSDRKEYRYHKAKVEIKYFLHAPNGRETLIHNPYLSVQGFYFPQRYRKDNSWLVKDGTDYQYDYSHITRNVTAASFVVGDEEEWNKVTLDYYFGLGVRQITLRHHTTGAVQGFRSQPAEIGGNPLDLYEGTFYRPHIVLGFKVGYSFRE